MRAVLGASRRILEVVASKRVGRDFCSSAEEAAQPEVVEGAPLLDGVLKNQGSGGAAEERSQLLRRGHDQRLTVATRMRRWSAVHFAGVWFDAAAVGGYHAITSMATPPPCEVPAYVTERSHQKKKNSVYGSRRTNFEYVPIPNED